MTETRDHCPECDQKLHPQELATLLRGRKQDCWYCSTTLKARSKFNLEQIGQTGIAGWALVETFLTGGDTSYWTLVAAGAIVVLVRALPPGLMHGPHWVRILKA
ncbi:MAG: hypothetical protein GVY32_01620 [Gammaproteobacteria bacterium]|nr:hypothetical protein [Gammaproteobacteria bacterium]